MGIDRAFGAVHADAKIRVALEVLARAEVDPDVVRIPVEHEEVIPAVAHIGASLATPRAVGLQGMPTDVPVGHIEDVDVLLDDDVAR